MGGRRNGRLRVGFLLAGKSRDPIGMGKSQQLQSTPIIFIDFELFHQLRLKISPGQFFDRGFRPVLILVTRDFEIIDPIGRKIFIVIEAQAITQFLDFYFRGGDHIVVADEFNLHALLGKFSIAIQELFPA